MWLINCTAASSEAVMETEGFPPPPSLEDSVRDDLAKKLKEKNMQFRYKAVEDVMAPLIHRVSTIVAWAF